MQFQKFWEAYFPSSLPFSFHYHEQTLTFSPLARDPSLDAWDGEGYQRVALAPDGCLEARLCLRRHPTAVEWWLTLKNPGAYDSCLVDALCFADLTLSSPAPAPGGAFPRLLSAQGSLAQADDFMPRWQAFSTECLREFSCLGGRSSDGCMPYFNLQLSPREGVILAIGWSGQWQTAFQSLSGKERPIHFTAQLPGVRFRLHPGEAVELPRMLALPWEGEVADSFNQWRRVLAMRLPRYDGKPLEGYVTLRSWGGVEPQVHAAKLDNIKKHGLNAELYQIDAGWHGEGTEKSEHQFFDTWWRTIGTWKPLPALYPQGMAALARQVKEAGLAFALWFEPERITSWNPAVDEHPDFFLGPRLPELPGAIHVWDQSFNMLLNLGNPAARQWIFQQLSRMIRETDMDVLRIDFNLRPLKYWQFSDGTDRQGLTEIHYVNGLYALLSSLRRAFPALRIDNCASGGRRLDYRMFEYSMPIVCRSDYFCDPSHDPAGQQAQTYGLSLWTPVHGDSIGSCIGHVPEALDTYRFHSALSSGIGMTAPWKELTEEEAAWYRARIQEARRARPLIAADFYPLTGYTLSPLDWLAMQFHDPKTDQGMVMAFRREENETPCQLFALHGIDPNGLYRVEDSEGKTQITESGQALLSAFLVEIPEKRGSRILFYEKIGPEKEEKK